MPDSRQMAAPSRSSTVMQAALPAALLAITVAVAFLFQRMEELAKELARIDQGRLTIARATAEALAARSRVRDPASSAEGSGGHRKAPVDSGLEEEAEEEVEDEDEDGGEERVVEIQEAQNEPSGGKKA